MHWSQHKLCNRKWSFHSRWNFISTFTELHVHGDERWPLEVTSNTYFRGVCHCSVRLTKATTKRAAKSEWNRTHPRVLPLVRHGDDVSVEQVLPLWLRVPPGQPLARGNGLVRVSVQPVVDDVVVKLLTPQQARVGLATDGCLLAWKWCWGKEHTIRLHAHFYNFFFTRNDLAYHASLYTTPHYATPHDTTLHCTKLHTLHYGYITQQVDEKFADKNSEMRTNEKK